MKKPLENEYVSHVAYCRDLELYCSEIITRLEAAEKDAERWEAFVFEAERDYVEVSSNEKPYWVRLECEAAMEEHADAIIKEMLK